VKKKCFILFFCDPILARARLPSAAAAVLRCAASAPCRFLEPHFLPLLRLLPADHALALLRILPSILRRRRVSHKALAVLRRAASAPCRFLEPHFLPLLPADHALALLRLLPSI
jgi:hypothetical protein